jgi:hypothetical protein
MPKGKKKERKPLRAGMVFTRKFKDKEYSLNVIEIDGRIKYKTGENLFNSPTAAAEWVVKKKYAVNGWVFWGMKNY